MRMLASPEESSLHAGDRRLDMAHIATHGGVLVLEDGQSFGHAGHQLLYLVSTDVFLALDDLLPGAAPLVKSNIEALGVVPQQGAAAAVGRAIHEACQAGLDFRRHNAKPLGPRAAGVQQQVKRVALQAQGASHMLCGSCIAHVQAALLEG